MTFQIISERETTLLVLENGKIKQLSKDLYNLIRVKRFNNERIIQTFNDINSDDEIEVQETFNKGIFNVKYKDVVIQLRNRNKVCSGIEDWYHTNEIKSLVEQFTEQYKIQERTKIARVIAGMFPDDRVVAVDDGFEIDGIWKVDNQGTAFINSKPHTRFSEHATYDPHNPDGKIDNKSKWKFLCIVPKGKIYPTQIDTEIGKVDITETDVGILSKIAFLLDERKIFDTVFFDQIKDKRTRKFLEDEYKSRVKQDETRTN